MPPYVYNSKKIVPKENNCRAWPKDVYEVSRGVSAPPTGVGDHRIHLVEPVQWEISPLGNLKLHYFYPWRTLDEKKAMPITQTQSSSSSSRMSTLCFCLHEERSGNAAITRHRSIELRGWLLDLRYLQYGLKLRKRELNLTASELNIEGMSNL